MRLMWMVGLLALVGCKTNDDPSTEDPVDADSDGFDTTVDCDDANAAVNPDADEVCNGIDDDCDDAIDVGAVDATTGFADVDGDGFGADDEQTLCEWLSAPADNADDCDDGNAAVNPAATEVCDPADVDEDCSGAADDEDPGVDPSTRVRVWRDDDHDGYGQVNVYVDVCDPTDGWADNNTDCDDDDPDRNPALGCYSGTFSGDWSMTVEIADVGVYATCRGLASVVVDESVEPTIEGSYTCTTSDGGSGAGAITGSNTGNIASGSVFLDTYELPWSGGFDGQYLYGGWSGSTTIEGLVMDYDGVMILSPE